MSDGLETQNGKCPARRGPPRLVLLTRGFSPGASSPGAARLGPPGTGWLTRGLHARGCSPEASSPRAAHQRPPDVGLLARGLVARGCSPGPPGLGLLARGCSPEASICTAACPEPPDTGKLALGLQAQVCSPGASSPGATRPGTPGPGLPARSLLTRGCSPLASSNGAVPYHGSSCLKPLPLPERNGSEYPTQPPDHGVSAVKCTGKVAEVGDTEFQAAPPGAMQRAQNSKEVYG